MTISSAYSEWASTYDADRNHTRDLDQQVTREALGSLACDSTLEVGCGTGKNTMLLSQISRQVVALDFSEGMIGSAKAKVTQTNVTFALADLTQPWPCASSAIDLIVCNLVLEHIQNLQPVFSQAGRVLKSGGQLFLSELHPFRQYQGGKATFQHNEHAVEIDAYIHHLSEFAEAALSVGFKLSYFREHWHVSDDRGAAPRLVSFLFDR